MIYSIRYRSLYIVLIVLSGYYHNEGKIIQMNNVIEFIFRSFLRNIYIGKYYNLGKTDVW